MVLGKPLLIWEKITNSGNGYVMEERPQTKNLESQQSISLCGKGSNKSNLEAKVV